MMIPEPMIPEHLRSFSWYPGHLAWLRSIGITTTHNPGDAAPVRANLWGADLQGADLRDANLRGAYLRVANLQDANLQGADLQRAILQGAYLRGANLQGAILWGADLQGADLWGAKLPDGRTLSQWQADPLAGLCSNPEAVAKATEAWGSHSWEDCPMHAANGWGGFEDAPESQQLLAATFVALFDSGHLPKPSTSDAA